MAVLSNIITPSNVLTATNTTTLSNKTISGASNTLSNISVASGGTGVASLTANNVILGNGTAAVQFVAPGTAGNVLTSNGTTWSSSAGGTTGQAFYGFGAGAYSWTVPTGVTSVCVVCIGAGAGSQGAHWSSGGGGGGGLAYENNITVVPGQVWTVNVGLGGDVGAGRQSGGSSSFVSPASVTVCQANGGSGTTGGSGGTTLGYDGGGNGGNGNANYGGGGAGGYAGNGGAGNASGSGGGAAGGISYSSTYGSAGGGGVAPFGQGTSGTLNYGGAGGSGGETASGGENPYTSYGNITRPGGRYGGGGGGSGTSTPTGIGTHRGADGCVRIIWGTGRSFPSTGTGDM
jgi:hypothetical protein